MGEGDLVGLGPEAPSHDLGVVNPAVREKLQVC